MTNYTGRMAEQRHWRSIGGCSLIAIVAIGAYLRSLGLHGSLWLDELHTAWIVSGDLADVAPRAMIGNQPPLAYWPLWFYVQGVGVNETSLRLPSLVASLASIVLIYVIVQRWTNSIAAALLAAAALAIQCDSFAFYASEARIYALAQCIALVHLLIFDAMLATGKRSWRVGWVLVGWLLFYLHYTLALLVVAEVVAGSVGYRWRRGSAYPWRSFLIDIGAFILGCLPAWPHLRQIAARRQNWELFIERPQWQELWERVPHEQALWWLLAGWLGIVTVLWWKRERPVIVAANPQALAVVIAWLCVPLLFAWVLSRIDIARVFFPRYLVFVLPAGGALLGVLAAMLPTRPLRAAYAVIAVVVLAAWNLWLCQAMFGGLTVPRNENWRDAMAVLNQRSWQAGEPLFVAANLIESEQLRATSDPALHEFCLYPLHAAYPLLAQDVVEIPLPMQATGKLSNEQRALAKEWLQDHAAIVFVVRGSEAHARHVAKEVVGSFHGDVRANRFQDFGLVWIFELQAVPEGGGR